MSFFENDQDRRIRQIREENKLRDAERREQRRQRVAQLKADPAKQKYAQLVEQGYEWPDEKIAYHEDLTRTGACPHLQQIERAIRKAGISTQLVLQPGRANVVSARCSVNETLLRREFELAASVRYVEGFSSERALNDLPWAEIACTECGSSIKVLHPQEPGSNIPWFPRRP